MVTSLTCALVYVCASQCFKMWLIQCICSSILACGCITMLYEVICLNMQHCFIYVKHIMHE